MVVKDRVRKEFTGFSKRGEKTTDSKMLIDVLLRCRVLSCGC